MRFAGLPKYPCPYMDMKDISSCAVRYSTAKMDRKATGRSAINQSSSGCSSTQFFCRCCCWCFLGRRRIPVAVILIALAALGLIRWLDGSGIAMNVESASLLLSSMISEEAASTPKAVAVAPTVAPITTSSAAPIVVATSETTAPTANVASAAVVSAAMASIEPPVTLKYHGSNDFRTFLNHWWVPDASEYKGLCSNIQEAQQKHPNARVDIEFTLDCAQLFQDVVGMGTGNVIELLYVLRLQCYSLNATLHLSCPDASSASTAGGLVLPWLLGSTDTSSMSESVAKISNLAERACGRDKLVPIGVFYRDMQVRLRSMVITLAGLPPHDQPHHPSFAFAATHLGFGPSTSSDGARNVPIVSPSLPKGFLPDGLLPSPYGDALPPPPPLAWLWTEMDDVALHFRCGDLMNMAHPVRQQTTRKCIALSYPTTSVSSGPAFPYRIMSL